jgi:4-diphosphocytidyl-2-C-methyl-D-erythritol kinase
MKTIHLRSPAKLNLTLKVLRKRPDGYHDLSTLFEKIDLFDDIYLKRTATGKIRISCAHPDVPKGPKNLVYKVARMLQDDFALANGVDIRITKRIPVAAGLAGGSSNAAAALLGLNKIWRLDLSLKQMQDYARRIGSDVALFLHSDVFCHGTERGDRIKGLKITQKYWHIVVTPRLKVYSAEVFKAFKMGLTKISDNVNILTCALRENDLAKARQFLSNDLETAIVRVHPQLLKIKNNIRSICGIDVCFSGSGPSIYGLVASQAEAKKLSGLLKRHYGQVFVARTM